MAKFLAVFNVVAAGASIAGLYLVIRPDLIPSQSYYKNLIILFIFAVTILMSTYVLFVPDNPIERNVRSKMQLYYINSGSTWGSVEKIGIQTGTVELDRAHEATVKFHPPYIDAPDVELIFESGDDTVKGGAAKVTPHQAIFSTGERIYSSEKAVFTWIARGKPLNRW